ncbi:NADH-quinone oxidoreductase subunit J [Microbacterium sp. LRZ72]|uniref:NADH-quinone oxidoreductase subunit J n=1 Tax=Microbacterium sp. LRZ72 TaxID=2942481 RepID=UPI0029A6086F|nr:NADH-quinone oxidoreductase subunit J [Microbacterium sp. LRZ72]MDX2376066.1 NADH-quinone oxidoreductase subunit J [Microbacterium sp. LRZ72]
MPAVIFWLLAAIAVAAGVAVFVVNSMARATYALAASFVAVGAQVLLLDQSYMGLLVILMMVMEMAIMALYMVMLMGMNPALMPMSMRHSTRTALIVSAALFVALAAGILLMSWPERAGVPATDVTAAAGDAVMESKMLVMLVMSPIMVATIVSGVVIAHSRGRYDRFGDDLTQRPARDPEPGGVGRGRTRR